MAINYGGVSDRRLGNSGNWRGGARFRVEAAITPPWPKDYSDLGHGGEPGLLVFRGYHFTGKVGKLARGCHDSKKNHHAEHFFSGFASPEPGKREDDLADRAVSLMTIRDASMAGAGSVEPQKVAVVAYGDAVGTGGIFQVLLVRCSDKASVSSRRDVNSPLAKSMADGVGDAFVKMIANLHRRRCLCFDAGHARLSRRRRTAHRHGLARSSLGGCQSKTRAPNVRRPASVVDRLRRFPPVIRLVPTIERRWQRESECQRPLGDRCKYLRKSRCDRWLP